MKRYLFARLSVLTCLIMGTITVGSAQAAETEQDIVRREIFTLEAKAKLGARLYYDSRMSNAGANLATSCRSCHASPFVSNGKQMFADVRDLSVIPANSTGGKLTTKRNTPNLQDATIQTSFNADGRYTDLDTFLKAKLTSLHFGWEEGSEEYALNQIHALLFTDQGEDAFADGTYIEQFNAAMGVDINTVNQEVAIQAVIDSLIAYLETLQTTNTSAYDSLAYLNRFNEGLAGDGDTPQALSGRIIGRITNQESRVSIRFPNIYDEAAYQGYKTFIRIEPTYSTSSADVEDNIGNCIACHVPPKFTDGLFHNTGTAQTAYDAEHGEGAFAKLDARLAQGTDLGRYSVDASDENVGAFKTPGLRNVAKSSPYNHDGSHATLEDVVRHKIKISEMAKAGTLRNPDPAYLTMNLTEADVPNLVAFLKTLDEVPEEEYRDFRIENVRIRQDQLGQQTYDN